MATEEFTLEKPDEISMMMYLAQFCTPGQRILLLWIQQQIPDEKVSNFSDSWVSGKALGALTNAISGGRFPGYAEMTSDNALANIEQAMVAAEKMLGVRRTITPAMFSEVQLDELFRLSYLAQFQSAKESRDSLMTVVAAADKVEVSDLQIPDAIGEGKSVSMELDCSDAGYGEVKAEVVGRKENIVTTTVKEVEDDGQLGLGKYRVSFVPPCVDVYDFSIRYGGEHVIGSPFSVNLYPPDPEKVQHTGTRDNSDTRQDVALNFKTKEAGRGKLSAKAEGEISGNLPIKITPLGDGTFAVNFHPQFPDIYTVDVFWGKFSAHAVGEISGPVALQVNRDKKSNYCVCFKPPNPDKYRVDVSWDGKPVPGSPFIVDLLPPPMPEEVECTVPIYNKPGKIAVLLVDASNAGKGRIKASCTGERVGDVPTDLSKVAGRTYQVTFTPPQNDLYTLDVLFDNKHVKGSPFKIDMRPGVEREYGEIHVTPMLETPPDATKCILHDAPKLGRVVYTGKPVSFSVDCRNAGPGELEVSAEGAGVRENPPDIIINPHPHTKGVYGITFIAKVSSPYILNLTWFNNPIPNTPLHVSAVDPAAIIHIHYGKPVSVDCEAEGKSGDFKAIAIHDETNTQYKVEVTKPHKNKYRLSFLPRDSGLYRVHVRIKDEEIRESPFIINYGKGLLKKNEGQPSRPGKCTVRDQPEYVYVNCPIHFVVDAKEAGSGELCIKASVLKSKQDVSRPELKIEDNKDGTFDVDYVPNTIGKHSFNILWSGQVIPNSPVNVDVRDKGMNLPGLIYIPKDLPEHKPSIIERDDYVVYVKPQSPFHVLYQPPPEEEPAVESPAKEEIQAVFVPDKSIDYIIDLSGDPSGNLSAKCRGEESGPVPVTCEPINLDSKKYRVTFVPPRPDLYHLSVFFNGKEMKGSPHEIDQRKKIEDLEPAVEGPAREEIQPVFVPDKPIDHNVDFSSFPSGTLSAKCRGEESGPVPVTYEPISPDSKKYRFAFVPSQPDLYHLSLFFNDKEVKGSPYEIDLRRKVKKSIDSAPIPRVYTAPEDHQFIPDDKEGTPTAPETHHVPWLWSGKPVPKSFPEEAVPRFPHGQPIEYDLAVDAKAGDIEAHVIHKDTNSRLKVKISKVSKGKYHFSFSPKKPGLYALHILVKKKDIKQSPIYFLYEGPPNPEACLVKDVPEEWYIHEQGSFTVDATEAGTASLSVKVTPPERGKGGDIKVINNGNGTYTVEHTPEVLDSHTIALTWAGKAIPNSPVTTSVKKRVPTAKAGLGPYTNIVPVGDRVEVNVVNLDKYASDRKYVTASARAKVGTDRPEIEYKEGMCAVSFVPTVADDYSLSVKISDEEIDGSSFLIKSVDRRCLSKDYAPTEDICSSDVEAGRDVCLVIPKDDSLPHGSEPQVEVRGPEGPCEIKLIDQVESSYGLNFTPSVPGDYLIHVRKDKDSEAEIESSPYKIRAVKKEPDAHKVIIPDSFHSLFVDPVPLGSSLKFDINTANASSGTLKIQQSGEGKANIVDTQKSENVYTCNVVPTERGRCQIDIQWNDESIRGSPFHLMFVSATGIDLEGETFMVGTQNRFTVDRRSVLEGHLEIHCSDSEAADISIMPAKDGLEFFCIITVKKEGNYQIIVKYNGYNIAGSPFNVHFMKPASANMGFSLKAEGAETSDVSATIQNSLTREQLPVNLSDLFSGNYALEFVPVKGLEYLVTIKCRVKVKTEEKVVTGSPFALRYERIAGDASKCRAEGQGLTKAIAGEWSSFFVYTEGAGSGEPSVDIAGDVFGDEEAIVSAISPTEFKVRYILRQKGSYQISVTWDGQDIPGSAFQITCSAPVEIPGSPFQVNIREEGRKAHH